MCLGPTTADLELEVRVSDVTIVKPEAASQPTEIEVHGQAELWNLKPPPEKLGSAPFKAPIDLPAPIATKPPRDTTWVWVVGAALLGAAVGVGVTAAALLSR